MVGMVRTSLSPGFSRSTRKIVGPSSARARTRKKAAPSAPVVNHFLPSRTNPLPFRRAVVLRRVGSAPAPMGSVMAKALRTSPAARGPR